MFKLVRHFSLTSAAAILVITAMFVLTFHRHESNQLLAEVHERNSVLARVIANGLWSRYSTHLRAHANQDAAMLRASPVIKQLDSDIDLVTEKVDNLKLRILAPSGLIIYSTSEDEIGAIYAATRDLEQTFRTGKASTRVSSLSSFAAIGGMRRGVDVGETHFPITDAAGKVIVVFDLYADVTAHAATIRRDAAMMALLMMAAFGALYAILLAIVRRADRILRGQYDELGRANALLEERVRSRTAELETSAREVGRTNERLREEIDERRRAEAELAAKRQTLLTQQAAIKELIKFGALDMARPAATLHALTETAARALGVDRVSIWLLSENGERLVCLDLFQRSPATHSSGYELKLAEVPAYRDALMSGALIAADDALDHPATAEFKDRYLIERGIGSMLDVPVMRGGRIEGVLCNEAVGGRISWSPEQQVFAVTIANLVAQLLESRDRDHAVAENRTRSLALLRHQETISSIIEDDAFRAGDRRDAMRVITRSTARSLGADRVTIWLIDGSDQGFSYGEVYLAQTDTFEVPGWLTSASFAAVIKRTSSDRIVAVDDVTRPNLLSELDELIYIPNDIRSVLHAPIKVHGRTAGFLTCTTVGAQKSWSADHKLMVASVVNLAALALERHERERAEAELRIANQRLEAATRAKSEFLANMSHEIRTPMNAVFGMTDLLARTTLDGRQRRLVGTISQSGKTLLTVINDILDFSRIEAGKLELERREFDLRQTVEGIGELFAEVAQNKGVNLTVFVDNHVPQMVVGDQGRLRQVLVNLIGNAVKFTSRGEIAVRATAAPPADPAARPRVTFAVADTGIGIDAAVQPSLFGAFTQADSSISRRFGGTGLGLSISKRLVAMMGGEMTLSSIPGSGTTVTFSLTMECGRARAGTRGDRCALVRGKRVLIADNRVTSRDIARSYLADCGAEIDEADTDDAAFAALEAATAAGRPFDVALVDVVTQGGDRLELVDRIRRAASIVPPRIILLASLGWAGADRRAREHGVDAVLTKPLRRSDMLDEVAKALTSRLSHELPHNARERPPATSWPGRLVLVVEDNPVNVEVAREYLEYFRCRCEVAHNGLEAIAAIDKRDYDLILMDVQMPEMDGLSATRRIRERERSLGKARTPIVGVTANAFEEDRQACSEAGMDGYMSKPFDESELRSVLAHWLKYTRRPAAGAEPAQAGEALSERAIASLEATRPDLLHRMVRIYLDYAPKTVAGLRKAIDSRDLLAVKLGAHSLKSSSANVGGETLSALLRRLETAANALDEVIAGELVSDVEREFARLRVALEARVPLRDTDAAQAPAKAAG